MDSGIQTVTTGSAENAPVVLFVDDSPDARAMCSEYLGFCGFRVVTAKNA